MSRFAGKFSSNVVTILDEAQARAYKSSLSKIGVLHVLGAILDNRNPMILDKMKKIGLEETALLESTESPYLSHGKSEVKGTRFSPAMEASLKLASSKAKELDRAVEPIDLLYAVLVEGNSFGALFNRLGLDPETELELLYS